MTFTGKTTREWVGDLLRAGAPYAREFEDALDDAEQIEAVRYEFGEMAPDRSLEDEARRLVTFENRVYAMLEEWGAIDPNDPSPPDALAVLRMLLGPGSPGGTG